MPTLSFDKSSLMFGMIHRLHVPLVLWTALPSGLTDHTSDP